MQNFQKEQIKLRALAINFIKELGIKKQILEKVKRVSMELCEKQLPNTTIIAEIIKEIPIEKTTQEELTNTFGKETIEVANYTKQLDSVIKSNYEKIPTDTLNSIILSIPKDFQPIILMIADTSDTLEHTNRNSLEKNFAKQAEEVWFPLATKLGLSNYSWKIQDYSFRAINPEGYNKVKTLVNKDRTTREKLIKDVILEIQELLTGKMKIKIMGRPKTLKSIHDKMKKKPFSKIHDIYGIRIICDKEKECYEALGYVHAKYEIIPESFDDYIAKPWADGYQSIHTAVRRGEDIIEIQIRTWTHHLRSISDRYWNYKKIMKDKEFEKELSWERQLLEWQKNEGGAGLGKKISGQKIFAFTPKNKVIALPNGATAIDFAFAIHSDIGTNMEHAKINGKIAPIETKLKNLDKVEIITSQKTQVKKNWIGFVITEKAKHRIKSIFGFKPTKKPINQIKINDMKKVKMAECCNPLPGEDIIGVRTTKRKIIVHKRNCQNIKKIDKTKLIEVRIERDKGKTQIRVNAIDRPGILPELLEEIKKGGATLINTTFKIKKTGYTEAIFGIEIANAPKLDKLIEKVEQIPGVQSAERI